MKNKKIRYAVVGLGHIAQVATLPAFKNARKNSELVALVSSDATKLKSLGRKYKVPHLYSYENFEDCLSSGLIDAVYIATPNNLHQKFIEKAARYGVHVLCEKPLAPTEEECALIKETVRRNEIKLMVAYRLHFEPANLAVIELIKANKIGDPRIFNSIFTMQITDPDNIRLKKKNAGGPLYDIGIYCLNASRYLFQDEPNEAFATAFSSSDPRFKEVEETLSVTLRFPKNRIANFTVSFGTAASATYDIIGTKGRIRLDNAYEYASPEMVLTLNVDDKEKKRVFKKHDQFAPELEYFSNCILKNKNPEPSVDEGLLDLRVIEAIFKSVETGKAVKINTRLKKIQRPSARQKIWKPAHKEPKTVHVQSSHN